MFSFFVSQSPRRRRHATPQVETLESIISLSTCYTPYTVKRGDTLWGIAQHFYGNNNGNEWPKIYDANTAVIGPNPNLIHPGEHLRIPFPCVNPGGPIRLV